jgi:hypothetical protein
MSQANVYTSWSANTVWNTDKCEITTTTAAVSYNVYATALGNATPVGNIYSAEVGIPLGTIKEVYVGAGNRLTITGSNFYLRELGTQSSAQYGVIAG